MPTLLGAHSPKLDAVRALRSKSGRAEAGRFAVEGTTMLAEALGSGIEIEAVFGTLGALDAAAKTLGALGPETAVYAVPDRAMDRLSDLETPPGLIAVTAIPATPLGAVLETGKPLLLLCGVADPGNAGTLLRSAEIFGFGGVLFGLDSVEPYNPKVVRGSMGAIFRIPVPVVSQDDVRAARQAGYELVATGRGGTPLPEYTFARRSIVAVGNERRGVEYWLSDWDRTVSIPQAGAGESLNAGVAGSIVAYSAAMQFRV